MPRGAEADGTDGLFFGEFLAGRELPPRSSTDRYRRSMLKPSQIGVQAPDRHRLAVNRRVEDQLDVNLVPAFHSDVEIRE